MGNKACFVHASGKQDVGALTHDGNERGNGNLQTFPLVSAGSLQFT